MNSQNPEISYLGQVDFRTDRRPFGIYQEDRLIGGMYLLGKTGVGKTNLLEKIIYQDITFYRGICVIDIHGDMVRKIRNDIPEQRQTDLVYIDVADPNLSIGYNPLRKVSYDKRHLIASHIIETFKKTWGDNAWGVKLEYILRNTLLTLLDQREMSLSDIPRILIDESFRKSCMNRVCSDEVKDFWTFQFEKYSKSDILPVLNKVGAFLTIPCVKKLLVENKEQLLLSQIMDTGKILLIDLSKGAIGQDAASLLGSLFLSGISSAAYYRVHQNLEDRRPFHVFLDEFHHFTTLTMVNLMSEIRKYKVSCIMAHQYLGQLSAPIRDAVLGNVGTIICFRISTQDAKYMAQEFYPIFQVHDLISLENFHIYLKLMIRGKPSNGFSAKTFPSRIVKPP